LSATCASVEKEFALLGGSFLVPDTFYSAGLKFSACLPVELATRILGLRMADGEGAGWVIGRDFATVVAQG
jgi:hypothetical protein